MNILQRSLVPCDAWWTVASCGLVSWWKAMCISEQRALRILQWGIRWPCLTHPPSEPSYTTAHNTPWKGVCFSRFSKISDKFGLCHTKAVSLFHGQGPESYNGTQRDGDQEEERVSAWEDQWKVGQESEAKLNHFLEHLNSWLAFISWPKQPNLCTPHTPVCPALYWP